MPSSSIHRITLDARLRRLSVRRVVDLSATMRRVELVGPDLEGFACHGPTDHAKVFFPVEPDGVPALPDLADGRFTDRFDPRYVCREYTVRTHSPGDDAMVLDLATHDHGPAGRWAAAAEPGRELGVYGPKTSKIPPMDRPWYLLAADEAGLPALTNWLERLAERPGQVHALIEVDGPADEVPLPTRPGVEVTWVHRGGVERGTRSPLADAIAAAGLPGEVGETGDVGWVWAGAEASTIRAVRGHMTALGMDRAAMNLTGYWRHGVANFDHKTPEA